MLSFILPYVMGAITVLVIEAAILVMIIRILLRPPKPKSVVVTQKDELLPHNSGSAFIHKQGQAWVAILNFHKDTKGQLVQQGKGLKEAKVKRSQARDSFEYTPVLKNVRVAEHLLIFTDTDDSEEVYNLKGCDIKAVSGSDTFSRKWAKKYPIRLECKSRVFTSSPTIIYMYFETGWEKEAWCKSLRLASLTKHGKSVPAVEWYLRLKSEFEQYYTSLKASYPAFFNVYSDHVDNKNKTIKDEVVSSKVRLFLKKIAKKASKTASDGKNISLASANQNDTCCLDSSNKSLIPNRNRDDSSSSSLDLSRSQSKVSDLSEIGSENTNHADQDTSRGRDNIDQGALCCNLIFSRLFFDARSSPEVTTFFHAFIQRLLSKMRTPSYISGITCTKLDVGKIPPYVCKVRALPGSTNEEWSIEADIEYSGGAIVDIESRVEAQAIVLQETGAGALSESGNINQESAILISSEVVETVKDSEAIANIPEKKDQFETKEGTKSSSSSTRRGNKSSWKGMLNLLADQVSQKIEQRNMMVLQSLKKVPIALSIKIFSMKGTIRISIKPPPSDRIWIAFTEEPNIEWRFEPSIGDHKITFSTVAEVIANRIKAVIRDTLVLPNFEDIYIPWMQAEKDDWVPESAAPFPWIPREPSEFPLSFRSFHESCSMKVDGSSSPEHIESAINSVSENIKKENILSKSCSEPGISEQLSSDLTLPREKSLPHDFKPEDYTNCTDLSVVDHDSLSNEDKRKKSRREKMKGLGKKVSEKLEEKKRHLEEKSRHIVDKMRGHNDGSGSES